MKSDIIYKIGTAEFRKRYIDPAIKSGKITYDYKLRYGTQAFRETGNKVILEKKLIKTQQLSTTIDHLLKNML